jgi:hypothetical protein
MRKFLFKEDSSYSQFKNTSIRDLNRIHQCLSDAKNFKNDYEGLINGVIVGLNTQLRDYKSKSNKAIRSEIFLAMKKSLEKDSVSEELKISLDNNVKPTNSLTYKDIPAPPEFDFEFEDEFIVNMFEHLPDDFNDDFQKRWKKSEKKEYAANKNEATRSIKEFLKSIDRLEDEFCDYRTRTISLMNDNLKYLIAVHYNYAYSIKNKLTDIKEEKFITLEGKKIKLQPSQRQFLTNALTMLLS